VVRDALQAVPVDGQKAVAAPGKERVAGERLPEGSFLNGVSLLQKKFAPMRSIDANFKLTNIV
jgi:hypothetical protein